MTYLQAALAVLKQSKRTLSTNELWARIEEAGLVKCMGRTPQQTLSAALYRASAAEGPLKREYTQGVGGRATRGSVRWRVARSD